MLKQNKGKLFWSSLVILLPMLLNLLLRDHLPQSVAGYWGVDGAGNVAGFVAAMPLFLLVVHWICLLITEKEGSNRNQTKKAVGLMFWIIPVLSLFCCTVIYAAALDVEMLLWLPVVFTGALFVLIGNYMPKCKQNFTLGVRTRWTLSDEETWNATHRFAGKVWVIGGLTVLVCVFLPKRLMPWALMVLILLLAILPMVFARRYYKKQVQAGKAPEKPETTTIKGNKFEKKTLVWTFVLLAVIVVVTCFTGDIHVRFSDTSFTVEASYWQDLTVDYAVIDHVEYRDSCQAGTRVGGYGSPRLLMGNFRNEEFGMYVRYSYTKCPAAVVITSQGRTLVLSGKDAQETQAIYEALTTR